MLSVWPHCSFTSLCYHHLQALVFLLIDVVGGYKLSSDAATKAAALRQKVADTRAERDAGGGGGEAARLEREQAAMIRRLEKIQEERVGGCMHACIHAWGRMGLHGAAWGCGVAWGPHGAAARMALHAAQGCLHSHPRFQRKAPTVTPTLLPAPLLTPRSAVAPAGARAPPGPKGAREV